MKLNIRLLAASIALCLLLSACTGVVPPENNGSVPQNHDTEAPDIHTPVESPDPVIPEPEAESFVLSFAGDCTLGNNYDAENASGTFRSVVKDNYAYPLSNVKQYFEDDDFTFVNLECALTESDPTEEEMVAARERLAAYGNRVDCIITHMPSLKSRARLHTRVSTDGVSIFLGALEDIVTCHRWYFGSLHMDKALSAQRRAVFRDVLPIEF